MRILLPGAVLALLLSCGTEDVSEPAARMGFPDSVLVLFSEMDTNQSGFLEEPELFVLSPAASLKAADVSGDGRLSLEELREAEDNAWKLSVNMRNSTGDQDCRRESQNGRSRGGGPPAPAEPCGERGRPDQERRPGPMEPGGDLGHAPAHPPKNFNSPGAAQQGHR